jgi:hypothetical protein
MMLSSGFLHRVDSSVDAKVSETVSFSETSASTDEYTRRQNAEQHHHPHRRENLKFYKVSKSYESSTT